MKVLMMPNPLNADAYAPSGITTVLRDYARFAPDAGIEFVDENAESFDVLAVHAGMSNFLTDAPYVAHCHGLYWTGDYKASAWEYKANRDVISSLRRASIITVPSDWVSLALERDMHVTPVLLPHAIDASLWKPNPIERKYVLWNKNRSGDVCDPAAVRDLANYFPSLHFISTFASAHTPPNVLVTGPLPHTEMREVIQSAHVYLSTTKETFGIGILEALASGVPVLGYAEGGILGLVQHGVNGYLAKPGNINDLAQGLIYCMEHHAVLSQNALLSMHKHEWPDVMQKLYGIYQSAMGKTLYDYPKGVSVVVPCYNYAHHLVRAIESVMAQELVPEQVIIVDDGSTDDTPKIAEQLLELYPGVLRYIRTENQGVAHARNRGMAEVKTKYACCLDADDTIDSEFLSVCVRALEVNRDLGLAYTRLMVISDSDDPVLSEWPTHYNFDNFVKHKNQVPTCCVFRTELFRRAGGYRQRYAPHGAGSEDANLWMRMGSLGYGGALVDDRGLFHYHLGGRVSSGEGYHEVDWTQPFPWALDGKHPFASVATSASLSHEVYQRDTPKISIVIPCTEGHSDVLWDAIDSVEGQTFRDWQLIVVLDGTTDHVGRFGKVHDAFPFIDFVILRDSVGAGAARNRGAELARGEYLLFLDADDWLDPHCLEKMYEAAQNGKSIIYSDYIGHAQIDEAEAKKLDRGRRLIEYDTKTSMASIIHYSADYDCELAQRQPHPNGDSQFYIWNIVTSLIPKRWHDEISGFDEKMESWEDWDYWIRQAKQGRCFERLKEGLVHYRFYTGQRREIGRQQYADLIDYMREKYSEAENMACKSCRGPRAQVTSYNSVAKFSNTMETMMMSADSMVLVELIDGNIGSHPISMRDADGSVHKYGYHRHGDKFLMRHDHAERFKQKYKILDQQVADNGMDVQDDEEDAAQELPAPTPLKVFTSSENDKQVAHSERDARIAPKPEPKRGPKKTAKARR